MEHIFSNVNEEYILLRNDFMDTEPFNKMPLGGVFIDILFNAGLKDGTKYGIDYKRGQCVTPAEYYTLDLLRPIKKAGYIDYKKVIRNKKAYLIITVTDFDYKREDDPDYGEVDQFT